eukprot:4516458-Amphidinium_carterae.1
MFAWAGAVKDVVAVRPPPVVVLLRQWFAERVLTARVRVAERSARSEFGELFCTDAKAEGELIVVGGWASGPSCGRTQDAQ